MPWSAEERTGMVLRNGDDRLVVIPRDFVLVGDEIIVRQENDGVMTIPPATVEGRQALESFNPFHDWEVDDRP